MASKSKKLGLAADIFEQDIEGIIRKIAISEIQPAPDQPRTQFDETINDLAESIKTEGLLQPIVVTKEGAKYKIIAGERRFRAAKLAGLTELECRILRKNPKDTHRLAVIENLQRVNLNPLDEAKAFRKLKTDFSYSDAELAKIVGKSRNYVNEILSVAEIPAAWLEKAKSAGFDSTNFFIQFAQAVKSGMGDAFISEYQSGKVKTVAEAKAFNKSTKPGSSKKPPPQPTVDKIHCKGDISGKHYSLKLEFDTVANADTQKLRQLEKVLTTAVQKFFS